MKFAALMGTVMLACLLVGCATGSDSGQQESSAPALQQEEDGTQQDGASAPNVEGNDMESETHVQIDVNGSKLDVTLEDNSSAQAFAQLLEQGALTLDMDDYAGMEKVGELPTTLPRNDEQLQVQPGDVILYQGNQVTVYYGTNSWSLTKLGHIDGVDGDELAEILGSGSVEMTFSLAEEL